MFRKQWRAKCVNKGLGQRAKSTQKLLQHGRPAGGLFPRVEQGSPCLGCSGFLLPCTWALGAALQEEKLPGTLPGTTSWWPFSGPCWPWTSWLFGPRCTPSRLGGRGGLRLNVAPTLDALVLDLRGFFGSGAAFGSLVAAGALVRRALSVTRHGRSWPLHLLLALFALLLFGLGRLRQLLEGLLLEVLQCLAVLAG